MLFTLKILQTAKHVKHVSDMEYFVHGSKILLFCKKFTLELSWLCSVINCYGPRNVDIIIIKCVTKDITWSNVCSVTPASLYGAIFYPFPDWPVVVIELHHRLRPVAVAGIYVSARDSDYLTVLYYTSQPWAITVRHHRVCMFWYLQGTFRFVHGIWLPHPLLFQFHWNVSSWGRW